MGPIQTDTLYFDKRQTVFWFRTMNENAAKINRAKRVASATYGPIWVIPGDYPEAEVSLQDFKKVLPNGKADPAALERINYIKSVPESIETLKLINSLDYTFRVAPFLHQLKTLEYMLHFKRLALSIDMGLGKTFISLHFIDIKKLKAIVFAPKVVLDGWAAEARKFTDLKAVIYRGTAHQRENLRDRVTGGDLKDWDVIVTNYEAVMPKRSVEKGVLVGMNTDDLLFFKRLNYNCVIIDEASRLKGVKGPRSEKVLDIASRAEYRYLLSGTLSLGNPLDVFMPFRMLDDSILGSNYYSFENKYCTFSPYNKHIVTGYKDLETLKAKVDRYMLVLKRDDCLDLPDRIVQQEPYILSDDQEWMYQEIKNNKKILFQKELHGVDGEVRCHLAIMKITKLQQLVSGFINMSPERDYTWCNNCQSLIGCMDGTPDPYTGIPDGIEIFPWSPRCVRYSEHNGSVKPPKPVVYRFNENPKLEYFKELLVDLGVTKELKQRCIVWAQFQEDLRVLKEHLTKEKISFITPDTQGSDLIYNSDLSILVYIGQISQGIGTTIRQANTTIYYSYSMKLDDRLQSMERNYRIGQTEKVLVKDLVCPGTVEQSILNLLDKKEDVKNFIQSGKICGTCPLALECLANGIRQFTKGCIHVGVKDEAEKKVFLTI